VVSVDPDVLTPVLDRLGAEFSFVADVGHLTVFGRCAEHATDSVHSHSHGEHS
jgi:Fur family ferric uptake transcriptional regulator